MRLPFSLALLPALTLAGLSLPAASAARVRHASAKAHPVLSHSSRGHHAERVAAVHRDPVPAMDPERASAIQAALIHAGYLGGEPTGVWDADSVAAMQKLQDANGWQTKYTPDSRALVKLGLGAGATPAPVLTATQPAFGPDASQTVPVAQQ